MFDLMFKSRYHYIRIVGQPMSNVSSL